MSSPMPLLIGADTRLNARSIGLTTMKNRVPIVARVVCGIIALVLLCLTCAMSNLFLVPYLIFAVIALAEDDSFFREESE